MTSWAPYAAVVAGISLFAGAAGAQSFAPGAIDGEPLNLTADLYGELEAQLDGTPPGGWLFLWETGLSVAVYDGSANGFTHFGVHASEREREFQPVAWHPVSGSGTGADPYVQRTVYTAGAPPALRVTQLLEYVDGETRFVARYRVENISERALNFRASVVADLANNGGLNPAYGRFLPGPPRYVGAFSPPAGVPAPPGECCDQIDGRGQSSGIEELPSSPWSRFAGDTYTALVDAVRRDIPFGNTFHPGPLEDAVGAQWDSYGKGRPPLEPGATATFELAFRFTNDLLVEPYIGTTAENRPHVVTLSTRYGEGGPVSGLLIGWRLSRGAFTAPEEAGSVRTDSRGEAQMTWTTTEGGSDYFRVFVDANEDGLWQPEDEILRRGARVRWVHPDSAPPPPPAPPPPAPAPPPPGSPPPPPSAPGPTPSVIRGTSGPDVLVGTPGNDLIYARGGNDVVRGLAGNDTIYGGRGRDRVGGGSGRDRLIGGPGRDTLLGGPGGDVVFARDGARDVVYGGRGRDLAHRDRGLDRLRSVELRR